MMLIVFHVQNKLRLGVRDLPLHSRVTASIEAIIHVLGACLMVNGQGEFTRCVPLQAHNISNNIANPKTRSH